MPCFGISIYILKRATFRFSSLISYLVSATVSSCKCANYGEKNITRNLYLHHCFFPKLAEEKKDQTNMIKQSNSLETLAEKEMLPPLQQSNHSAQRIPIFPTSTCSSFSKINSRHDTPVRKFLFWFAYYT